MNKYVIAALSFAAGATVGFLVGHFVTIEQDQEESRITADDIQRNKEIISKESYDDPAESVSPPDDDPSDFVSRGPAHIARPGVKGVNYAKVNQIVSERGLTDPDDIQEVIDDPDNEETEEERLDREMLARSEEVSEYRKKNKDKIVPIPSDEWDTDFPDIDYEHKDLYYFVTDDVLTDDDGNPVDEEEYIGTRPRQFGWMNNGEEYICIRNNPKETDFKVWKQRCASTDWWS